MIWTAMTQTSHIQEECQRKAGPADSCWSAGQVNFACLIRACANAYVITFFLDLLSAEACTGGELVILLA